MKSFRMIFPKQEHDGKIKQWKEENESFLRSAAHGAPPSKNSFSCFFFNNLISPTSVKWRSHN